MQFSTGLIVLLTVLGIVFHYLQKQQAEEDDREQKNSSLSSSSSASSSDQQNSSLSSSLSDQQQFLHEDEDGQRKDYSYDQLNRQQAEDDIVEQKNSSLSSPLDQRSALEEDSERKDLSSSSLLDKRCQRFSLAKIKLATNDFDDNLLIGEGGFGKVYKGKIEFEEEGIDVAIKRLNLDSHQGVTEFRAEIEMLSTFRHSHIVSLLGYHEGSDKKEMILVYEYMPNGSLEDHLHKRRANASNSSLLTWIQRLHICIGAARGLDYLHTGTGVQSRVIHRDVKSSNILLDGNLAAKIADFGLSRIGPANHTGTTNVYTDHIKGTFGYMDAESYATRRLTRKSDVYAFGVVLLEVLCGRPALDFTLDEEQHSLAVWANNCIREGNIDRIIDPCLTGQMSADCLNEFGQIACECILTSSKDRPTMTKIVARLEFVLALGSRKHGGVTIAEKMWSLFSMKIPAVHAINYRNRQKRSNDNKSKRVIQDKAATTVPEGRSEGKDTGIILVDPLKEAAEGSNGNINKSVTTEDPIPFMTAEEGSSVINKVATTEVECHDAATMLKDQPSSSQNLKIFTFNELQRATLNFRRYTKSDVYDAIVCKGWVDSASYAPSASGIAIDVLMKLSYGDPAKNRKRWEEELNLVMGTTSHPNVVKLLGYCWASDRFFLVYEDTQNGSLYKYLFGEVAELLTWDTRMKIAMGAAQGLAFLHTRENNVISTILTSKNILLDREFNAKLTDFGDVGLDPAAIYESSSLPLPDGYEYFAPEYVLTGVMSAVYSFGVVMLEMITGLCARDTNRQYSQQNLVDWARPSLTNIKKLRKIIDPRLEQAYPSKGATKVAELIQNCLHLDPNHRPSMEQVVAHLKEISTIKTKRGKLKRIKKGHCMSPHHEHRFGHPHMDRMITHPSGCINGMIIRFCSLCFDYRINLQQKWLVYRCYNYLLCMLVDFDLYVYMFLLMLQNILLICLNMILFVKMRYRSGLQFLIFIYANLLVLSSPTALC